MHCAFRGRLLSPYVLRTWVSPRPILPQESPCISFAEMVQSINSTQLDTTITMVDWSRRAVDSCGKSTCLKTQKQWFSASEADRRALRMRVLPGGRNQQSCY